jgi:hypothetical protein
VVSATKSSPGFATRESLVTPVNSLAAPGCSLFRQSLNALRTSSIVNTSSSQRVVQWLIDFDQRDEGGILDRRKAHERGDGRVERITGWD